LKMVFKTETGTPIVFPSTGTGGWESALSNCLSPGDKVLASRFGQFSTLWVDMCQRLGLEVEVIDCEWGEGVPVARYHEILDADKQHKIKAVLATHNETATGVTSDIAGVRAALREFTGEH
jgi:alanine-glyoxylate transaminase / serine-glyoxylate transaminase / serine-pyruvate transaminase